MKGGKRAGAGRPKGALGRKTRKIAEKAAETGVTPLEFMLEIMRDEQQDIKLRAEMAKSAAPFMHPRLESIAVTGKDGGPIETKDVSNLELARRVAFLLTVGARETEKGPQG